MDFDLFVQNENKINNKKQKKNNRPFSSNPLGKNLRVKSSRPRVKTGLPKLNNEYFPDNIKNPNLKITLDNKFDQTNEVEMQFVKSIHLTTKTKQVKEGQHITIHVSYDPELYEQINYHLYPENNKTMDYVVHFR